MTAFYIINNFDAGKKRISLLALLFLLTGGVQDQIINYNIYGFGQLMLNFASISIITISIISFLFISKKNYKVFFSLSCYAVISIIVLGHFIFDSYLTGKRLETFLLDSLLIIVMIGICGLISGKKNAFIMGGVLLLLVIYYAFINILPFVSLNFLFFVLAIIGYSIVIYFTVDMTDKFIETMTEANKKTEAQRNEIALKNRAIMDSIQYAKRIQTAILPTNKIVKSHLPASFIFYRPKDIVAGDFYWMENIGDTTLFAAADCTGHGVPGALISVLCYNGLNRSVNEYGLTDPGEILSQTKKLILAEFEKSDEEVNDGMDIALCALKGNQLQYAGAFNPMWLILNKDDEIIEYLPNRQPIGNYTYNLPYVTHTVNLNEGDTIYIFTDGLTDQFGGKRDKKYKRFRLKQFLLSIQKYTMDEQRELIGIELTRWQGKNEQVDDICFIGMRYQKETR